MPQEREVTYSGFSEAALAARGLVVEGVFTGVSEIQDITTPDIFSFKVKPRIVPDADGAMRTFFIPVDENPTMQAEAQGAAGARMDQGAASRAQARFQEMYQ